MNFELHIINIVDLLSISTAFLLGLVFVFVKSKKNKSNIFLGLFLWSLTLEVFTTLVSSLDYDAHMLDSSTFTIPLLCLYIVSVLGYRIHLWYGLLLLPCISQVIDILPFSLDWICNIGVLCFILYVLASHNKKIGAYYSDIENKTLSWIKGIVYVYLFFHGLWIIEEWVGDEVEIIRELFASISAILTLLMIYWVGYKGVSQPGIFDIKIAHQQVQPKEKPVANLSEITIDVFQDINNKVLAKEYYKQADITISKLANELSINEKDLSRLINDHTGNNFYHFINHYRVEEFKRLIHSDKSHYMSLLGLAEEAGFASKSTFYHVFKSYEGMTPKQYFNKRKKSE